jgi:transposase
LLTQLEVQLDFRCDLYCRNGISQAANLLIPEAEGIKEEVLIHRHPRMDETGYAVVINNREVRWVWAFSTESAVFYRFHESRGADILKEHWPNGDVIPVSDGWRAYNHFEQLQLCWAHFLRHLENAGKKCDQAFQLFLGFQQIYHDIKLFRSKRPEDHHEFPAIKLQAMVRINDLIDQGSPSKACELLKGALVHIENAKDQLLTALDYPELVLDNNLSERNLRKIVIHRKIRGYVASEQGIINLSTFATVFETWRMQKINPYDELEKILKQSAY